MQIGSGVEPCNMPVHFSIAGQIYRQIKNLPLGPGSHL
jgi:hypothetical protein